MWCLVVVMVVVVVVAAMDVMDVVVVFEERFYHVSGICFYFLDHPSTCWSNAGHTCVPLILRRIVANLK